MPPLVEQLAPDAGVSGDRCDPLAGLEPKH